MPILLHASTPCMNRQHAYRDESTLPYPAVRQLLIVSGNQRYKYTAHNIVIVFLKTMIVNFYNEKGKGSSTS